MKLWIDDMRDAPDHTWTEVRKVQPAIGLLALVSEIEEISIDHDIEHRPDDETFKPVAYFIGEKFWRIREKPNCTLQWNRKQPKITVHSDNPVGARELVGIFKDYGLESVWEPFTTHEAFKTKYGLT